MTSTTSAAARPDATVPCLPRLPSPPAAPPVPAAPPAPASSARPRGGAHDLVLQVVELRDAADDVRTVVLAAPDGTRLPSFTPGSHLVLDCDGRRNAYSLTGPTVEPETYSISVLHQRGGRGGSRWVHRHLGIGATVSAAVPRSAFPPVLSARHHLFVAGGIGVTAMVSHVRAAVQWGRSFTLLYSYRPGSGAHLDELRELCGERLVELHGRGETRRALEHALTTQPLGTHVYTCGPAALIDTVDVTARDAGWPAPRVHAERFAADDLPPGKPFTARLTSTGGLVGVPSGTSLLEALEAAGVAVANRCRQGVCGECRIGVAAGRVEHRDLYLSPEERAAGDSIMACVSRGLDDTVDLVL